MVVKKRKIKSTKKQKKSTIKRRNPNPSLFEIRDHMDIRTIPLKDGSGKLLLTVYYMGEPVIRQTVTKEGEKLIQSSRGRDIIAKDIKDVLDQRKTRKNPDEEKKDDKKKEKEKLTEWKSPVGLPSSPLEIWKLGYHAGLEEGIGMCGITDYFKRREVRQMLQSKFNQHFRDLTSQLKAAGDIIGAKVPRVRAGAGAG